jgi:hypothetical protein
MNDYDTSMHNECGYDEHDDTTAAISNSDCGNDNDDNNDDDNDSRGYNLRLETNVKSALTMHALVTTNTASTDWWL